jgi:flagellin
MSVVINTNVAANIAANNLATSNTMLQKSLNRLSSGSKIVTPADDAGGLAVAMKLSAAAKRSGAAVNNIGNAISLLQTQDGVLKVTGKVLDRMGELATLYTDETKDSDDKAAYAAEFTQLNKQLDNLAKEEFNGTTLMTAAIDVYTTESGSDGSSISITATSFDRTGLTITDLAEIKAQIVVLGSDRANNGAVQSTLGFASEVLSVNKSNLEAAASRISDVDVAEESTQLARWNVLVSSGTAMLAQANQAPQSVLKLLG